MAIGVLAALIVFVLWAALHLLSMHIRPTPRRFPAMTRAFLLSFPLVPLIVFVILRRPEWREVLAGIEHPAAAYGMGILLHILFYFCFVECFYHVERAVTLRMVIELFDQPGQAMPLDAMLAHYPVDDMIQRRLEGLRDSGFVWNDNGIWRLTPKGRLFASAMKISSAIFHSKPQNERIP